MNLSIIELTRKPSQASLKVYFLFHFANFPQRVFCATLIVMNSKAATQCPLCAGALIRITINRISIGASHSLCSQIKSESAKNIHNSSQEQQFA